MTRTYISTLGFHETRVTRPILQRGLDPGDSIVLVRPAGEQDEQRAANAVDYVKDMVHEIEPEATVAVERIDPADFVGAVRTCGELLRAAAGETIVNLGGGAREVFLPLTVATVLHAEAVDIALQYTDIDQEVREWPVPNCSASVSDSAMATLSLVCERDEVSLPDLADASDRSRSAVTRHVEELAAADAVATRLDGQTKIVSPTPAGSLLRDAADR